MPSTRPRRARNRSGTATRARRRRGAFRTRTISLFEDPNPRALEDLLAEIHNRSTALPDFQRDFVWEPGATQELIVSIASNYPAGSILRVRDAKRVFAAREFEGAPALDGAKHPFLVLDGQQRLTSLYQAFYGVGEHRYFLDLGKLRDGADFEESIFHVRTATKWAKAREDFGVQAKELLLPLSVLKRGAGGFGRWGRKVARQLADKERIALEDALDSSEEKWIHAIDDYHFPVVTLSDKTEPDALCTIFETLNRTGVKLSVFELLTARFWPQSLNLRALWDKALVDHPVIGAFEVDPYYVLQGMTRDLEDPLSPGSGEGQSRDVENSGRTCERASDQALRAAGSRAHDRCLVAVDAARGRYGLVRARSMGGSRWATGSLARTPQLIVAAKRFASNAVPRASM